MQCCASCGGGQWFVGVWCDYAVLDGRLVPVLLDKGHFVGGVG